MRKSKNNKDASCTRVRSIAKEKRWWLRSTTLSGAAAAIADGFELADDASEDDQPSDGVEGEGDDDNGEYIEKIWEIARSSACIMPSKA